MACGIGGNNLLVDYHLHLERGPLTRAWLEEFLEQGRRRGVAEFGFSEHAYRFRQAGHLLDSPWGRQRCVADLEEYLGLLSAARAAGLPVRVGVEMDYLPEREEAIRAFLKSYRWDFVLGSVHWLGDWGVDLADMREEHRRRGADRAWREYFGMLGRAAGSRLFDVLAHPDLIKIFGDAPAADPAPLWDEAVAQIAAAGCAVEVSSAGLRRPVGEIYPAAGFLERCRRSLIPVTMASDAHMPQEVGQDLDRVVLLLRQVGYREVLRFRERVGVSTPL